MRRGRGGMVVEKRTHSDSGCGMSKKSKKVQTSFLNIRQPTLMSFSTQSWLGNLFWNEMKYITQHWKINSKTVSHPLCRSNVVGFDGYMSVFVMDLHLQYYSFTLAHQEHFDICLSVQPYRCFIICVDFIQSCLYLCVLLLAPYIL